MKLLVLTCAVFPSKEDAESKLWIYLKSCKKFGMDPVMYGIGERFPGYRAMKLDMQLDFLKSDPRVKDFTHALYTDAWDCFFTGSLEEIIRKYEALGSPKALYSCDWRLANVSDADGQYPGLFDKSKRFCYPNVGGYLAEIPYLVDAFERMNKDTGDDCFSLYGAIKEGWYKVAYDFNCDIFQISSDSCSIDNGRLKNDITGSHPCVYHLSGGYTDQVTGKDDRLIPWAKELGII